MAYKANLIVEVTTYTYNGTPVKAKGINGNVVCTTKEII